MTLRIRNLGSSALNPGDLTADPPTVGFMVVAPPAAAVAPGGTTSVELGFAPLAAGEVTTVVRLPSDDEDEGRFLPARGLNPTSLPPSPEQEYQTHKRQSAGGGFRHGFDLQRPTAQDHLVSGGDVRHKKRPVSIGIESVKG